MSAYDTVAHEKQGTYVLVAPAGRKTNEVGIVVCNVLFYNDIGGYQNVNFTFVIDITLLICFRISLVNKPKYLCLRTFCF
jgi:hypothetical protein